MKNFSGIIIIAASLSIALIGCTDQVPSNVAQKPTLPASSPNLTMSDAREANIKKLEARVAQNDPVAKLALAKLLLDGVDASPDFGRAKDLLIAASKAGLDEANIGLYYMMDFGVIVDSELPTSEKLLELAFASNDPFVATHLFYRVLLKTITPPQTIVKFADSGYPLAIANLSRFYSYIATETAECDLKNKQKLKKESSAELICKRVESNPKALELAMGLASKLFDFKEVDAEKERYWVAFWKRLRVITEAGQPDELQSPLRDLVRKHVEPLEDAYHSAFAHAFYGVGYSLAKGHGIPVNPSQAAQFYERAAFLGNADAQNALGEFYSQGLGVAKNFETSTAYFAQAANQGNSDSALNIAVAYARAHGMKRDLVQAYFWLSIGAMSYTSQREANSGNSRRFLLAIYDPAQLRDELSKAMTVDEIAQAQQLVKEWKPSYKEGTPVPVQSLNPASSPKGVKNSQVTTALTKATTGTGFMVSLEGHAVTNQHVVAGCTEIRIGGRATTVKQITADGANDLALIQLQGGAVETAPITAEPGKLRQGQEVVAFGFPLNSVLSSGGNLTPGVVSALTGLDNNTNQIQITAGIQPGSSGSPVMNRKGEVVGVVSMKISDLVLAKATGSVGQNINFAVSGNTLKAFLDAHKVPYQTGGFFMFDKDIADLADEARKWTMVVECWK